MSIAHLPTALVKPLAFPVLAVVGVIVFASSILLAQRVYTAGCAPQAASKGAGATTAPRPPSSATAVPKPAANAIRQPSIPSRTPMIALSIRGVPVELYGLIWFLATFVLILTPSADSTADPSRFRAYLYWVAIVGLSSIAWIAYRAPSWYRDWRHALAALCLVCIFGGAAISEHASGRDVARNLLRDMWRLGRGAPTWIAVAVLVTVLAMRPQGASSQPTGASFEPWFSSQPRMQLPFEVQGARVVIAKFHDYQCGPCKIAYDIYTPVFTRLSREYPGAIRIITLDFPLDSECNSYVKTAMHPAACDAAVAVRLARKRGRGPDMEAWLFEHQPTLSAATIAQALRQIANVEDMRAEYPDAVALVRADVETAHRVGVSSTPTLFVNGVKLQGVPPTDLEIAIRHEMTFAAPAGSEHGKE